MLDHNKINALIMAQASIKSNLKPVLDSLKDNSIPVEDRWKVYEALVKRDVITEIEGYGDGFVDTFEKVDGKELTLYDDMYIEKYETCLYVDLLERVGDELGVEVTGESIVKWKERVLASGDAGFVYDW